MTFNIDPLRQEIEALLRDNPDFAEDDELRANMLEAETDMYSALTALLDASNNAAGMVQVMTERMANLQDRRARFARRVEALRGLMLKVMWSADLKKIELPDATLFQRAAQPQIVGEVDAATLPDDLVKITRTPDRVAIRKALLEDRELPGLSLSLSNAAPSLMIKVK